MSGSSVCLKASEVVACSYGPKLECFLALGSSPRPIIHLLPSSARLAVLFEAECKRIGRRCELEELKELCIKHFCAIVRIQAAWRGYIWRKRTLHNPHTLVGKSWLAACAISDCCDTVHKADPCKASGNVFLPCIAPVGWLSQNDCRWWSEHDGAAHTIHFALLPTRSYQECMQGASATSLRPT